MQDNKQLIEKFYTSFQQLDWQRMISCYHADVFFYDPVFENLEASKARAMWEMLCKSATAFSLQFSQVEADEEYGSCQWTAVYTFSATGRRITNRVKAHFKFHEGLIVEHMDDFDMWAWSRQALGWKGWVLGWSSLVKNKIRQTAKNNLQKFMAAPKATSPNQ